MCDWAGLLPRFPAHFDILSTVPLVPIAPAQKEKQSLVVKGFILFF
jgi:hypothetical protein